MILEVLVFERGSKVHRAGLQLQGRRNPWVPEMGGTSHLQQPLIEVMEAGSKCKGSLCELGILQQCAPQS